MMNIGKCMLVLIILLHSCDEEEKKTWKSLEVKASAYNSVRSQTDGEPSVAAWGDTLKPGMKVIAVSRDLISLGLKHNTEVKIEGLPDIYLVKDKMNSRYRNRIDVYMGIDIQRAKEWGQKKLTIQYVVPNDSSTLKAK